MKTSQALDTLVQVAGNQRKLAEVLDISEEHISRWRNGKKPIPTWVVALAEAMELLPPQQWPQRWRC
ncbi:MAG: helix-turn-helix domain-containing protein [Hyphomicrobiaceae bacterium]|nr:helix-turn-helix domain-containing protein [Hyphomicrobiaceae bacterium]